MFDKLVQSGFVDTEFQSGTLQEIIFGLLPHRDETCAVIYSHIGEQFVSISLPALRQIVFHILEKLMQMGLKKGDTILLASFSCCNELSNALIFTAAVSGGIRVFVPIFPEQSEFGNWKQLSGFSCVIMPYLDVLQQQDYQKEKEVISTLLAKCRENNLEFLDADSYFRIPDLISQAVSGTDIPSSVQHFLPVVTPEAEAVIFTTSGSSGKSKLVVYTHERLANCCQAWQIAGLFGGNLFGNPGFSPLFTHTIGIRTFLNSIWSGNPFCILVTDWFLHKPEVVRYLMLKMKLGHIIAGPAFYNTLMELFRLYPELKTGLKSCLKAAISIGAPYDLTTAARFRSATGVSLMNAFGTTETLMISLNRKDISADEEAKNFGEFLPGVSIGLKNTEVASQYELFIRSPFQSVRTIGEAGLMDYFETGDLVNFDENTGILSYYNRKSKDFLKDEYGVKIPLNALQKYYENLYNIAPFIEWIPLVNIPGLAALVFIRSDDTTLRQREIAAMLKNANEVLKHTIEPFEYAHRHLERFSLVNEEPPLTRKGTVAIGQIYKEHEQLISELRNPFVFKQYIETVETGDRDNLYKYSNPYMSELLDALKLNKDYVFSEGDCLFYKKGDELQRVLDLVGGFGSNLLGHNNPGVSEAIIRFVRSGRPALNNQASQYYYPALLAKELNNIFGKTTGKYFKVLFSSSGTEATELALHHAYYEWRQKIEKIRDEQLQLYGENPLLQAAAIWEDNMLLVAKATPCVIVADNCFHGYSSGARSLLNDKKQRSLFSGLLKPKPVYVKDFDSGWFEKLKSDIGMNTIDLQLIRSRNGICNLEAVRFSTIIASIVEPVRGEGGIYELNPDLAGFLAEQDFPLISDEIQCGMGRTGSFPSYARASYYLLGKSLGAGIEKIAAVLIDDQRFKPLFTKYFNSTFANGEMAAFAALTALKIIESENLVQLAGIKGEEFLGMLLAVASRYPDVIESVSGKGLMLGIHFNSQMGKENVFLRMLLENEVSGYFFSGWFLHNHHIRVLPSLSKPNSIRIEPSFYLSRSDMQAFCHALEELCSLCAQGMVYSLTRYLMNDDPYHDKQPPDFGGSFPQVAEPPAPGAIEVGFLGNFTLPHRELQVIEPGFAEASDTGLRILFNRMHLLLEGKPVKILSRNLLGGKIHFTFYVLPFDTSQLEVVSRWGKKRSYISKIQEVTDMLAKQGCSFVSLGAHTSIITGNGLNLAERTGCRILTGNSLAVASCLFYLDDYIENAIRTGLKLSAIAILGANGNIGSGLADCLDDIKYAGYRIMLAGNNERRLQQLKNKMSAINPHILCTENLFMLNEADVIICCANTNDPIVFPHHITREKPVFIIDISVPSAVSEEVKQMGNVHFCRDASSVFLRDDPELMISSHTPPGKIFCCAGEAIISALYNLQLPMKGHIHKDSVTALLSLAEKEGFFKKDTYEVPV